MNREAIKSAAAMLLKCKKAVAVTGAGVSTESGIPDFRGAGGLWSRYDPLEYGTIGAFGRNPEKIWLMLAELLKINSARPNQGHLALAGLEKMGLLKGIITQNIDGLHQKAGSKKVVEFHGSLASFTCLNCRANYPLSYVQQGKIPPACQSCSTLLKPDITFFDEQISPRVLARTNDLLAGADLMLVVGSSCQVAPASHLPGRVLAQGGRLIEINKAPVLTGLAAVILSGGFSEIMTALLEQIKKDGRSSAQKV